MTDQIVDLDRPAKWMLRILIEAADDESRCFCQPVKVVARATGYSVRQLQRIFAKLRSAGVLHLVRRARRHSPTLYRLELPVDPQKSDWRRGEVTASPPRCPSPSDTSTPSGASNPLWGDILSPLDPVGTCSSLSVLRTALTDPEKEQYRTTTTLKPELGGRSGLRQGGPTPPLDGGRLTDSREVQILVGLFRVTMRPSPQRVSTFEARMLKKLAEAHGTHLVQAAVVLASRRGGRTVAYIRVLLDQALPQVADVLREREAAAEREARAAYRASQHRPPGTRTTALDGQRTRIMGRQGRYALAIEAGNIRQVIEELANAKGY